MKSKLMVILAMLAGLAPAYAAETGVSLELGAAVKNVSEVRIAAGKSTLNMIAEGAGKFVLQGEVVRFYALCAITDTLALKEVAEGVGDCELKTTDGDTLYAHFQTIPGRGDRGHISISGGGQNSKRFNGSIPVEITVNPAKVGKMVFFVETLK